MIRSRGVRCSAAVAALALIIAVGGSSPPASGQSGGNAVSDWNSFAVSTLIALPGPGGGAPPAAQVNMGMVQGAVYDAVNATEPKHHRPYLLKRRFSARASQEAAVATAAYRVLSDLVAAVPSTVPFPARRACSSRLPPSTPIRSPNPRQTVQGPGHRRRQGGGRRDDRSASQRRTLRTFPVGAELRTGPLAAAAEPGRQPDPRPDPLGRRCEAVPDAELLAVPHAQVRWP